MIRAILLSKESEIVGEECALCRHPLAPGDVAVICPADGSRHHSQCWQANGNRCTAYGCSGNGEVVTTPAEEVERGRAATADVPHLESRRSKVRVLPSSSLGCAQSCLLLSIAAAIILIAIGCFGIWAIADYVMLEILELPYRVPTADPISSVDLRLLMMFLS